MKKLFSILMIIAVVLTSALLLGQAVEKGKQVKEKNSKETKKTSAGFTQIAKQPVISKDHAKSGMDCKQCHDCEYPTKKEPCLKMCPRVETSV